MAQPTRCDGHVGRQRLSHNNLRRRQWRRRPRAERRKPRRSANSSNRFAGCSCGAPFFLSCCAPETRCAPGVSPRSETAHARADVPGGRVRRVVRWNARNPQPPKGGIKDGEEGEEEGGEEEIASASPPKKGACQCASPFFVPRQRDSVIPSLIRTRRMTSPGISRSTTSRPSTTSPNTV